LRTVAAIASPIPVADCGTLSTSAPSCSLRAQLKPTWLRHDSPQDFRDVVHGHQRRRDVLRGAGTLDGTDTYVLVPITTSSGATALTAGTLEMLPGVPGRLPGFASRAFFMGAHTQRQAAEEFLSQSVSTFARSAGSFAAAQYSSIGSGGASYASLIRQLQVIVNSLQNYILQSQLSSSTENRLPLFRSPQKGVAYNNMNQVQFSS
jgi:hypothetical protein